MKTVDFYKFNFGTVKWNEMFDSEAELIKYLKKIDIEKFKDNCKGYYYIEGFQKELNEGKELSAKQLTQLKRLAKEVYRYYRA